MEFKSHFTFNKQQRSGILLLLLVIVVLLCILFFVDFSEEDSFDVSSPEIVALQQEMDSLQSVALKAKEPRIYPFNPNFITDYKGYTLGMSNEEIDRLLDYRRQDKWINSVADFQVITGVSDSLLNEISPYFKFPEWINNPKPRNDYKKNNSENAFLALPYSQKTDLNLASEEELQQVKGIGKTLSNRIVTYREKLNGFSDDVQLYQVYGLDSSVVQRAFNLFTVKTPNEIIKIYINKASASDIATIPGISFELAKEIWEYRTLRQKIASLQELAEIEAMTERKLQLIQLYLSVD